MKTILPTFALGLGLLSSASLFADGPNIQPGWWEYKVQVSSQSGAIEAAMAQAKAMMASMPPEQRAMMEKMMASHGAQIDLGNQSFKSCLTKADIEQMNLPNPDKNCQQTLTKVSKDTYKMAINCKGNPPTQGEGTFVIDNPKKMHGTVIMDITMQGQADKMTMQQNGRWLSADCPTKK